MHNLPTPYFEYWDEAPHDWQSLISQRVEKGESQVIVPILWGVHEPSRGMRDFSKQSKLRIERLFTAAQSAGASIKVVLGLPRHHLSFPSWANEEIEKEWVPNILWEGVPPYFSLTRVPSIQSPKMKEKLSSFLDEISSILSLYLCPGGPIKEVELVLQPLEFAQSIMGDARYLTYLEERYPDILVFNKRFQTHYKSLSSVVAPVGAKFVNSKRPWLSAFDFQWIREKMLNHYFNELLDSAINNSLKNIIKLRRVLNTQNLRFPSDRVVFFESNLVQFESSDLISPLMIQGQTSPATIQAFQWAQMLSEACESCNLEFVSLPSVAGEVDSPHPFAAVFCGKYVSSASGKKLTKKLDDGATLFFPMGVPQYDENLDSLDFVVGGSKKITKLGDVEWFQIPRGAGELFYPAHTGVFSSEETVTRWLANFGFGVGDLVHG